ncbi:MAG TPA: DinB family protein [Pyrinomonadaceae bacterium]|nr:DinB family protein [Pyrinomonadaceae bacterium]
MNDLTVGELINSLSQTPLEIANLLREFPAESLTLKPSADEFSFLENICHLRDLEVEGYGLRITSILNEEAPRLADFDGARVASERHYNRQNLDEALGGFTRARRENVALLRTIDEGQFKRTGELQGVGQVTLDRLLEMMLEHDEGHLEDLARLCRRIKPH